MRVLKLKFLFFVCAFTQAYSANGSDGAKPCGASVSALRNNQSKITLENLETSLRYVQDSAYRHLKPNDKKTFWQRTPELVQYFKEMRGNLLRRHLKLSQSHPGTEHMIRTLEMAAMMGQNAFIFGKTSSGKSTIARMIHDTVDPLDPHQRLFAEQTIDPITGKTDTLGFSDLDGNFHLSELAIRPYGLLDEGDKASALFFSSIFGYLQERQGSLGGSRLQLPIQSTIMTSNATHYELLYRVLPELGISRHSGEAILNRLLFKVLAVDFEPSTARRLNRLNQRYTPFLPMDGRAFESTGGALIETKRSMLPYVNLAWMGRLILGPYDRGFGVFNQIHASDDARALQLEIVKQIRGAQLGLEEQTQKSKSGYPYFPTLAVNQKTDTDIPDIYLRISLMYDLMTLSEDTLPTEKLLDFMFNPNGVQYNSQTVARLAELFTVAVPERPEIMITDKDELTISFSKGQQILTELYDGTTMAPTTENIFKEQAMVGEIIAKTTNGASAQAQALAKNTAEALRILGIKPDPKERVRGLEDVVRLLRKKQNNP